MSSFIIKKKNFLKNFAHFFNNRKNKKKFLNFVTKLCGCICCLLLFYNSGKKDFNIINAKYFKNIIILNTYIIRCCQS